MVFSFFCVGTCFRNWRLTAPTWTTCLEDSLISPQEVKSVDGIVIHPECRCWPLEKPTFCGAGEMTHISDKRPPPSWQCGGEPRLRKIFTLRSLPNTSEARNFEAMEEVEHNLSKKMSVFCFSMAHKKWCDKCQWNTLRSTGALYYFYFLFYFLLNLLDLLGYLCWIFLFYKHRSRKAMSPLSFRFRLMGWSKWTNQASVLTFDPCVFCRPVVSRIVMAIGHGSKSSQKIIQTWFSKNLTLSEYFFPNNGRNHLVILRPFCQDFLQPKSRPRIAVWLGGFCRFFFLRSLWSPSQEPDVVAVVVVMVVVVVVVVVVSWGLVIVFYEFAMMFSQIAWTVGSFAIGYEPHPPN